MYPCKQEGSTLLEVVIALLILALVVVGLNAGVVSLIRSNVNSKELTAATAVGNQKFEELRRADYSMLVADIDTVRDRYIRDWRVTDLGAHTKIDLTVYWPLALLNHSLTLSTIIAEP
ncbi:MAG: prepilin-type N-terminal cleavage/methylation domain-containing protein [Chitinispirillaceae bacterium]|nr:prepilin-type N-terminal cleavage/methylation domain-containing protein [Chitinispirillaceae bacterium]